MTYHLKEITRDGLTFRVSLHHDSYSGEPWKECETHGPVSDWTTRDKLPGELVLNTCRGGKQFYDYAEACRIARRDGWNTAAQAVNTRQVDDRWHNYDAPA
jgi:hypothetical protein